jgi:histidinol-phosphate aminotransferase
MSAATDSQVQDFVARLVRDDIRAMSAYPVPSSAGMVKLDAMENPHRLPEPLRAAIGEAVAGASINRYPDPTAPGLRARLREAMAIPEGAGVILGNGSDEIIHIVVQALARDGAAVLAPEPTFVMYKVDALLARVRYVGVPLRADFSLDVEAMLEAIAEHRPAVVFLAYPNNPSGNLFDTAAVERILRASPGLVVVDEAYHAFARETFLHRIGEFPNLMVMRTVSKLGLAGIRLGYAAAAAPWIHEFDKVRPPYNVGVLTQAVGETLLAHHDVLQRQADDIVAERGWLAAALAAMPGVKVFPSDANFLLARLPDAPAVMAGLKAQGVLVKNLHGGHPLLENCLRFTVGTPDENRRLLEALAASLGAKAA